jgi:cardiolipin synthase
MGNATINLATWIFYAAIAIYAATIVSCIVVVLSENRNPIRSLAWVIALIFLPIVGLIFYLFFGRSLKSIHLISRHNKRRLIHKSKSRNADFSKLELSEQERQLVRLASTITYAPFTLNNQIEIFTNGEDKFQSLIQDITNAKSFIYIQYYIFADDSLGSKIADLLIQKAAEGVEVKVIYDHVGSFGTSNKFFKHMCKNGVDAHPFFRVTFPQLANRINWRNHRKIVVIDREIAYIGGMNIADRYLSDSDYPHWRDTHFRLKGDIVESLLVSFAIDWNFMNKPLPKHKNENPNTNLKNNVGIQLVTSGPTDTWNNLSITFLKAISSARKSIYIQTPYFLPTEALFHAMGAAALSGIDVRIMMPRKSDSFMLRLASYSYITSCLATGIKVYLYEPGMLHAKTMIIDDTIVTAGSTNFDFRSFENNFECNLFIYDKEINDKMRNIFANDMKDCTKITFKNWKKRSLFQRTLESCIRLLSPIL